MKLIHNIYRLLVNLKQRTSRLLCLFVTCLATVFGLSPSVSADILRVDRTNGSCSGDGSGWGSDAFKYLRDALAAADGVTEDQIWVAATATYYPDEDCANPGGTDNQALSFEMIAGVEVYGGFFGDELNLEDRDIVANETILSGEIGTASHDDNSNHVVSFVSLSGSPAILDGFTVLDGDNASSGGGITVDSTAAVIIRNSIIRDNDALIGGGLGVSNTSAGDVLEVRNCLFEENFAVFGGGIGAKTADGDINVINCYLSANSAGLGGAVYSADGSVTFINTTFTENSATVDGGAAHFTFSVGALFVNSLFLYNTAADDGGAVYIAGLNASVVFDNCTLSKNHADESGGGILAWSFASTTTITNCILWGNTDGDVTTDLEEEQLLIDSPATVTVTYTCIEGLDTYSPGTGNIGVDPTFVDEDGSNSAAFDPDDNFRLNYLSPCIDAADNNAVECDLYDVDEDGADCDAPAQDTPDLDFADRRIDDPDTTDTGNGTAPLVDMGAYEFGPCPWDLNGDCEVGAMDLTILLANWGDPYGAADLLALLAAWGPCPCDPDAVVLSLAEELADACLSQADWDEYADVMTDPDSSQADKDRYDCWMTHYIEDCNRCTCSGLSGCPNPDPFN